MEQNGAHIAVHGARDNPRPQGKYTITRGFEAGAYAKIVEGMKSADLRYKRKALTVVSELLSGQKDVASCMQTGITAALSTNLDEEDALCRALAAKALGELATVSGKTGCDMLVEEGLVERLVQLTEDENSRVRDESFRTLSLAAQRATSVQDAISYTSVLPLMLQKTLTEETHRVVLALQTLRACLTGRNNAAASQLIANGGIDITTRLTHDTREGVSDAAVAVLAFLCAPDEGKTLAVTCESHTALLAVLTGGRSLAVTCDALAGLLYLSVHVEGKKAIIAAGGVEAVKAHLYNEDENLRLHVLQAIASLGEDPRARAQLQATGPLLQQLAAGDGEPPYIRRHADLALRSLGWIARGITV